LIHAYTGNYVLIGYNFGVNSFFYHNREARQAIATLLTRRQLLMLFTSEEAR
jgi:hypothetical protein